jgi:flagellar motility protein MotE (MotC chaperone)
VIGGKVVGRARALAAMAWGCPPLALILLAAVALLTSAKIALLADGTATGPSPPSPTVEMAPLLEVSPAAGPDGPAAAPGRRDAGAAMAAPLDPEALTPSEILVLQQLRERRAQLEERERALELRAALLETAEAELAARLVELEEIRAAIEGRLGDHDQGEEAKLASLVKIYETMKPKAAAVIFDRLDMAVLLQVVERMREPKASDVIARMDPVKAKQLTTELARRRPPLHGES